MFNGDRSAKYPNEQDMVHEGIPFINAGDLENGCVNLLNANKITTEKYNDLGGAKLQLGDIVYCLRGTLGKNAYIDNFSEGTVASSLVAIRPKNIDGKYLFYILNSDIEYSQRILHDEGAAQPNLSAKSVSEFIIPIPNIDEQKKLSSFFDSLSNLITLHQRKYDKLQVLKKAMLEKMFPKNGSSVPEIRFKGFTDAWEQRKLGDFCEMFNGDRSAKYPNEQDMVHEGIPFINAGDLENGCVNLLNANKITTEKYNDLGGAKLQLGDIVYCLRGTLGKNAYIDNFSEGTVASSLVAIRPKNIDGKYLFYILNSDIEYSQRILHDEGAAQPNLSAKSVSEFIIPIPNIDEQKKLSSFFDSLSNLITLHQRELEKLQNIKKSMLEKMFV